MSNEVEVIQIGNSGGETFDICTDNLKVYLDEHYRIASNPDVFFTAPCIPEASVIALYNDPTPVSADAGYKDRGELLGYAHLHYDYHSNAQTIKGSRVPGQFTTTTNPDGSIVARYVVEFGTAHAGGTVNKLRLFGNSPYVNKHGDLDGGRTYNKCTKTHGIQGASLSNLTLPPYGGFNVDPRCNLHGGVGGHEYRDWNKTTFPRILFRTNKNHVCYCQSWYTADDGSDEQRIELHVVEINKSMHSNTVTPIENPSDCILTLSGASMAALVAASGSIHLMDNGDVYNIFIPPAPAAAFMYKYTKTPNGYVKSETEISNDWITNLPTGRTHSGCGMSIDGDLCHVVMYINNGESYICTMNMTDWSVVKSKKFKHSHFGDDSYGDHIPNVNTLWWNEYSQTWSVMYNCGPAPGDSNAQIIGFQYTEHAQPDDDDMNDSQHVFIQQFHEGYRWSWTSGNESTVYHNMTCARSLHRKIIPVDSGYRVYFNNLATTALIRTFDHSRRALVLRSVDGKVAFIPFVGMSAGMQLAESKIPDFIKDTTKSIRVIYEWTSKITTPDPV